MRCAVATVMALIFLFPFLAAPAHALTITWVPTSGGLFNTPGNWSPAGPPGVGDVALFNLVNTQTVFFETDTTMSSHNIVNGNVTYNLNQTIATMSGGAGLTIGGTIGLTARLTLLNGKMTGDMILGNAEAATGFLTISTDATFDALAFPTAIGNSGIGTLSIFNGGHYTANSSLEIALLTGSNGTVSVSGLGSSLATNTGSIYIGFASVGAMTVSNNATASGAAISVGDGAAGKGTLTITDSGSSLTGIGNFNVGNSGTGTLFVLNGGTLSTPTSRIALSVSGTGTATVSGAGSTWNAASLAIGGSIGGNGGTGTLFIQDGGTVNVSGNLEIRASTSSALTIDGGTLNVAGNFTKNGALNLKDGTLHVTGLFDNGASPAALIVDGSNAGQFPTLRLSGASGTLSEVTSITIGSVNRGALIVDTGRNMALGANSLSIGTTASGNGSVLVTGSSSTISTSGIISVGGNTALAQGTGALTISQNGAVSAGTLNLFPQSTLIIDNGTLGVTTLNISSGATVDFRSGRMNFNALSTSLTAAILDVLLGTTHELGAGRTIGGGASTLTVATSMIINGGTLTSGSGAFLKNSSSLILNSGTLSSDSTFTNDAGKLLQVAGTGIVSVGSFLNNGTVLLNQNLVPFGGGSFTNFGLIRGNGRIGMPFTNGANSEIRANTANDYLLFSGAANSNAGTINAWNGGVVEFTAAVSNTNVINLLGGTVQTGGTLTNSSPGRISGRGTLIASLFDNASLMQMSAGTSEIFGPFNNSNGGSILITGGNTTTFYHPVANKAGAFITVASDSAVVFLAGITGPGTLTGSGAKYFADGSSSMLALNATGSTFVESSAQLEAGTIHEDKVTLFGHMTIPNGPASGASAVNTLSIYPAGHLDLANHNFMAGNTTLATIESAIKAGFNLGNPAPNAPAITSSTALSNGYTFLVPIDADALLGNGSPGSAIGKVFDGTLITQPNTILVKYSYIGDVNLDGVINGLDFATAAGQFNHSTPGLAGIELSWLAGDVNFDGIVNSQDFDLMSANAAFSQFAPLDFLNFSQSTTPVPETTTLLLSLPALSLLLRRRRV